MSEALLTRLLSMSRAIAGEIDRQSVLDKVAEELRHLIPHDHLDLALLVDEGRLHTSCGAGINTVCPQPESLLQSIPSVMQMPEGVGR
ncbi:MAG: hypothetical protein OET44_18055 [Gammaproteobacteria bacterium]|nr:hypothetical protein [Gammaproteobacteria bacterium]